MDLAQLTLILHQFLSSSIFTSVTTFYVKSRRLSVCALKTPTDISMQVRPFIFVMTSPNFGPSSATVIIKGMIVYVVRTAAWDPSVVMDE